MGTEKYSDESDYAGFIATNGGEENAFTTEEFTNFHFAIVNEHFQEALDRFAQMFISPLLRKGIALTLKF